MKTYIAFSGTAGVGKTTLVKPTIDLLSEDGEVKYISEVARSMVARGYKINKEATCQTQRLIEDEYLRLEHEYKDFIKVADRSIIDRYSYAMLNGGNTISEEKREILDWYDSHIESHCKKYSHIFYIPIMREVPYKLDGVRSEDIQYREDIAKLQESIIDSYNIKVYNISSTTPEERFAEVARGLTTQYIRNCNPECLQKIRIQE